MTVRKQTTRRAGKPAAKKKDRKNSFHLLADGLYEMSFGDRVAVDLLITHEGEVLTFLCVDGELVAQIPVMGTA